jgi:flagellar biosynthetic protein FliQ
MTDTTVIDIGQKALMVTLTVCAPILGFGLIIGLVISVFQAATQIHEMSLTFIPKMIGAALALVIFGPWMLQQVVSYTTNLLQSIPSLVR